MKALYILAAVLIVLFLLGQIRIGCKAEYSAEGPKVWVRLGKIRLQVFPAKPEETKQRAQKPNPQKTKKEKEPTPFLEKAGGLFRYAQALLPVVLEAAGQFKRKLQVDTLRMKLVAGGNDPADAAMLYGQASAALGALWYPLTEVFHVKDGSAKVDLDFDAPASTLYVFASLSLKLGQILWIGIYFGLKALKAFLAVRKQLEQKKMETQRKAA